MNFKFIDNAGISNKLKADLSDLVIRDEVSFLRHAKNYSQGKTNGLSTHSDLYRLAAALKAAEFIYIKYKEKGIPDQVFYDTLSDIGIWCSENKDLGLKNYQWIKNHLSFTLFRIGRLQFQIYKCKNPSMHYSKLPFSYGDIVINVHIPACGKLIYNDCVNSFLSAEEFFRNYFPEIEWDYFLCESWLVFEKNAEFMNNNSNILKFDGLFNVNYSINYEKQTYERLFNTKKVPVFRYQIENLPENTSLQKNAKEYRLSGNRFGIGVATIKKGGISAR